MLHITWYSNFCIHAIFSLRLLPWDTIWHHDMETFSVLLTLCGGNPMVNGEPLKKGTNSRVAGDLRQHDTHVHHCSKFSIDISVIFAKEIKHRLHLWWKQRLEYRLWLNIFRPKANPNNFADDFFKCISVIILCQDLTAVFYKNESSMLQIMAKHMTNYKLLPEPMKAQLNDINILWIFPSGLHIKVQNVNMI